MTIIVHFTDNGNASWLDGPFHGSGHCYRNYMVSPPRDGWQVIAPPAITPEAWHEVAPAFSQGLKRKQMARSRSRSG